VAGDGTRTGLPCLDRDRERNDRPEHREFVANSIPGPSKAFDQLQGVDSYREQSACAERGKSRANAAREGGGALSSAPESFRWRPD